MLDYTFDAFLKCRQGKKIIGFGYGYYASMAIDLLGSYGISFDYFVDNDIFKEGCCSLRKLKDDLDSDSSNIIVLICAAQIFEIKEQLAEMRGGGYTINCFAFLLWQKEILNYFGRTFLSLINLKSESESKTEITIMPINKCNLNCPMCGHVSYQTGEFMSLERMKDCLGQIVNSRIMGKRISSVRIDGNREALLYPHFEKMIEEIRFRGLDFNIVTNGTLLSQQKAENLVDYECKEVNISVTGITSDIYKYFQGYGFKSSDKLLNNVIANIKYLVEYRNKKQSPTKISIPYICTEKSSLQADKAIWFWKKIGVDQVSLTNDSNLIIEVLSTSELAYHKGSMCINPPVIASNGDVFACCLIPGEKYILGNCFETTLSQIFLSDKYFDFTEAIASLDPGKLPAGCRVCGIIAHPAKGYLF
ncbi:MAG: radical SAM protein [Bacteroidales bacterium]|jgi:radical SAM protein with 4Fe4S-binding SPASM domain|nr:radical SAM protein [Bacteroidales bacterium]